jgi:hypothetical protein
MKILSKLTAGVLAVGLLTSTASATDFYLYITGSTAFRNATMQGILNYLGATGVNALASPSATGSFAAGTGKFGYTGTNWSSAKAATFIAIDKPNVGDRTIVKASWSGSEAGVQAVTSPGTAPVKFLPASFDLPADSTLTAAGTSGLTDPTVAGGAASTFESHAADVCMADSYQTSSRFTSPLLDDAVCGGVSQPVGIVPFIWVVQKGAPAAITNIDPDMARSIWTGGGITSAMLLTGNTADSATRIYGLGRDIDSGTRTIGMAQNYIGIFTSVKQWRPNLPQGSTTITAFAAVSGNTYNFDNTSNTITIASGSIANIAIGMTVTGTNIPASSIVGSFVNSTSFKIINSTTSAAATPTGTGTGASLTIAANTTLKQTTGTQGATNSKYWSQYPVQIINGISSGSVGNGGEASGGNVAGFLTSTGTTTTGYGIAWLGTGDANTAVKGGATPLKFGGASIFSSFSGSGIVFDFASLRNGAYKFWGYEHMFYNSSTIDPGDKAVADGIANQIFTTDANATNNVAIDANLKVSRGGDTGPVSPITAP